MGEVVVNVREFDPNKDRESVEAVEKICEVGPSGKLSLFTDLQGDAICRVRNSPTFLMLVSYIIKSKTIYYNNVSYHIISTKYLISPNPNFVILIFR
jgi:hypothetical protein